MGELHLMLCDRHTPARDIFYKYYTQVAEWIPYVLCVLILLFCRIGDGVFATSALVLSGLFTQIIKHICNTLRPVTYFDLFMPDVQLPLVEGVKMNYWYSFPSGHTTSFFSLALVASVLITNYLTDHRPDLPHSGLKAQRFFSAAIQMLLFVLAALGGYSRIYLSQHFARDVFGGMIIGISITIVCYVVFIQYKDRKWYNFRLFQKK